MASQNVNPSLESASTKTTKTYEGARKDSHSVTKRLRGELANIVMSPDQSVSAFPNGDNLFNWIATIAGPSGSAYEGHKYKLSLTFPSGYPHTAPTVRFDTPIFHPNVDHHGNICLDILKEKWAAVYEVRTLLLSIQLLLGEPNTRSPLNVQAAQLWTNQQAYKAKVNEKYKESQT
ncbi:probable ubiquitin-conjugating enzyme E2 C [Oscarella lobularis]|uniref:probable ubiquitin-conjugating enzyme E2 C n=1 Tax=Oscarella lobularis TaxID=121494 RepID=UPI003314413C